MATVTEVKRKVDGMRSHEYEAWRSNPANRAEVAILDSTSTSTPGFKRIDLQAKPTEQRFAVLQPCFACGKDVAVASDHQGAIFCSEECIKLTATADQSARNILQSFANSEPRFYRCQYNTQRLVDYFQAHTEVQWNLDNVKRVFTNLLAEGGVLPQITLKDLQVMSPAQYDERERLDSQLGGWKNKIEKKEVLREGRSNRDVESVQPSLTLSPKVQALKDAGENQLRQQAAACENRGQTTQYRNGIPVEAPAAPQNVIFRNGRRIN
jgi:hypothetical protein